MNEEEKTKTKKMLKATRRRLKKLRKMSVFDRGHSDNEDLVKLEFREKQLKQLLKEDPDMIIQIKPKTKTLNNGEYI